MKNTPVFVLLGAVLGVFFVAVPVHAASLIYYTDAYHGAVGLPDPYTSAFFSGTTLTSGHSFAIGKIRFYTTTSTYNDTVHASSTNSGYIAPPPNVNIQTEVTNAALGDGNYIIAETGDTHYCFFTVLMGTVDLSQCAGYAQPIDWSLYYTPAVYSTSSAAIAASSTLWGAFASSSQLVAVCNTGNVLGDGFCSAMTFIFVPNPNVMSAFFAIPSVAATKFPFSWIYGVSATFSSLSVASTTAMVTLSYNFHDLGIGSTTSMGNILPNFDVFSKATIEHYISPTLWNTFQTLIAAGMWLSFIWFEFNRARHMAKPH